MSDKVFHLFVPERNHAGRHVLIAACGFFASCALLIEVSTWFLISFFVFAFLTFWYIAADST